MRSVFIILCCIVHLIGAQRRGLRGGLRQDIYQNPGDTRQCRCQEVNECSSEVAISSSSCYQQCQSHLVTIHPNVNKVLPCFRDSYREAEYLNTCLKIQPGFCSNLYQDVYQPRTDYSAFTSPVTPRPNLEYSVIGPVNKARRLFTTFRNFQNCLVGCMKINMVTCYTRRLCGVQMPERDQIQETYRKCGTLKAQVFAQALRACQCLVTQEGIYRFAASCPYVANQFYMRDLYDGQH